MRKILFISSPKKDIKTGGAQCTKRNLESLKKVFGINNVDTFYIRYYNTDKIWCRIKYYFNALLGNMYYLTNNELKRIVLQIKGNNYTDVFIDSSSYGKIGKCLKRKFPSLKIHAFFHNVEYFFVKSAYHNNTRFNFIPYITYLNEKLICRYSDTIICLNQRDDLLLQKYYNRKADLLVPITIKDNYTDSATLVKNTKCKGLFLGSYFFGNIEGLIWFCESVLPNLDIELNIVGTNMDQLNDQIQLSDKIHIYSNVPDLRPFFEDADFMILPILSGGGMKVKTAEALMYGKFIIGSNEALMGYNINDDVAVICESKDDYINAINCLKIEYKYNHPSRLLYLQEYSNDTAFKLFSQLFKDTN